MAQHGTAWHSMAQRSAAQRDVAQGRATQHNVRRRWHSAAQHGAAQRSTAQRSTAWQAQHGTISCSATRYEASVSTLRPVSRCGAAGCEDEKASVRSHKVKIYTFQNQGLKSHSHGLSQRPSALQRLKAPESGPCCQIQISETCCTI